MPNFRIIPSVEQMRRRPAVEALQARYGHVAVIDALRGESDALRAEIAGGVTGTPTTLDAAARRIEQRLPARLARAFNSSLRRVINATGVVIHTNLGRAPLSPVAAGHAAELAQRYVTLEYDLEQGERGHRDTHAEPLLCALTGAEAAVVVNNCAAATMLMLAALAHGREVIVSRGELVEIGGGFRVPDVMAQSGATLREVGTTNRTRAADYEAAVTDRTGLILRVHRSNFTIEGFTEDPSLADLVAVGRQHGVPVAEDLGSGNVLGALSLATQLGGIDPAQVPGLEALLRHEPTIQASLAAGVDVLCVSGDKLLGGPQAGIILGRRELVQRIRRHPLMRAMRVDKLTYAALTATVAEYVAGRAHETIPVIRMATETPAAIERRARRIAEALAPTDTFETAIIDGQSTIGGGTTPNLRIGTRLLTLRHASLSAASLEAALRAASTPVIARIEDDRVVLDLRTVFEDEDELIVQSLLNISHTAAR